MRPKPPPGRHAPIAKSVPVSLALALGLLLPGGAWGQSGAAPDCPADRELCVQALRSGGIDLKTGIAYLEGDVRGIVRSRDLSFGGHSLTAFRRGGQEWERLVLENDVRLEQSGRVSSSDHGVLERDEIRLSGHVRIDQEQLSMTGDEAVIRAQPSSTSISGRPDDPLVMSLKRAVLGEDSADRGSGPTTEIRALRAMLEEQPRQVVFSGNVELTQSDGQLRIEAQQLTILFQPDNQVESFRAEGNVVIAQPERRITADFAQSRGALSTILLVGHASLQQKGQFDLQSERMEVFVDSNKGIMQSMDRQKPIRLSLDVGGPTTHQLTSGHMLQLSAKRVPSLTLDKLAGLIGTAYPSRGEFRDAVRAKLTRLESERYLDLIVETAQ